MTAFWLLYTVVRILMGVASSLTNLFTLVCVFRKRYLRSSANILVASIALSDFLHGTLAGIVMPIKYFVTDWHYTHPLCYVGICVEVTLILCQFVSFSMLAFERRSTLLFQLNQGKKWNCRTITIVLAIMWASIALYNVVATLLASKVPEGTVCNVMAYYPAYFSFVAVLAFFVASIMITVAYGHIAWVAYKSQSQVSAEESAMQQMNRRNEMKITKMMAMVVGVFFALYCPFFITTVTLSPTSPQWHRVLFHVTVLIYDINFWINPFIYAWRDKSYRKAFREIMPLCCTRRFCGSEFIVQPAVQIDVIAAGSSQGDLPPENSTITRLIPRVP